MAGPQRPRQASWRVNLTSMLLLAVLGAVGVLFRLNFVVSSQGVAGETPVHLMKLRHVDTGLRTENSVHTESPATTSRAVAQVAQPVESRRTVVLIANYRDSFRCAETLHSLFTQADFPDLLAISLFDQLYLHENETRCYDTYCAKVGEATCRRHQLRFNETIDADTATGPTMARYRTEHGIDLAIDTFSMAIDSHLVFVPHWDTDVKAQWDSIENPNAVVTAYPRSTVAMPKSGDWSEVKSRKQSQLMCTARIETEDADAMIQYGATKAVPRPAKPQLMSQFAGGFNFGTAKQALEVRNDPYTPYLFHGEEYSKAARLFTHGYDMYIPIRDIAFHWYEKRNVIWEKDWGNRYVIQQQSKRRVRKVLGLPITSDDYDDTDIDKFGLGTKRTFAQFQAFSGIDPLASYVGKDSGQFNVCRELKYVPY
ncbi:Aste57867_12479 [Aphanomyces stellatus]|uniref:Aste57867_12479 protein n=1 Tax=Aphanomyces stellatus TaxID=120398 RepID=A0A485KW23_9STRA|nr:hypothetical protein As57867_012433 [Aphanomyces stellatus]VFT89330.1 Aste57867_12479 [Aphanomyces stellatus]